MTLRLLWSVVLACFLLSIARADEGTCQASVDEDSFVLSTAPDDCRFVLAPSTVPDAGWGIFTLESLQKGQKTLPRDVVIHLTHINASHAHGLLLLSQDCLWSAEETGGFCEGGRSVVAALPGAGMLANGPPAGKRNVLPWTPAYDEGGLTRSESPGAGAITNYHNCAFFATQDVAAGGELLVSYGEFWFRERQQKLISEFTVPTQRDTKWLRHHGRCLDNLRPGQRSLQPHAGRGAFAVRAMEAGDVVAPVPVLPVTDRRALDLVRERQDGTRVETKQLMLNYCFGHPKSSLLLYPYGTMTSLVNHGGGKLTNVRLQWSQSKELHSTGLTWLENASLEEIKSVNRSGFLLELVATKRIRCGEEVLLDYSSWTQAWMQHVQTWEPVPGAKEYAPGYVLEDVVKSLRTESELAENPYPDNVFTSCFYRYSDNRDQAERLDEDRNARHYVSMEHDKRIV